MSWISSLLVRRASRCFALTAVVYFGLVSAYARTMAAEDDGVPGRIDFADADLPPATVEVDLSEGMFGDLFGLGEAAVAGAAESLAQAAGHGEGTRIAAEQLAAARQILQLAKEVVREARVRVYENLSDESDNSDALLSRFDQQLRQANWENIVRVRDGEDNVRVSLLRKNGAVLGAFVVASDGDDLVLANIVGDISPENVRKLTSAATKIGLENGLHNVLEIKMQKFRHHRLPPPPPAPPAPPQAPERSERDNDR